MTSLKNGDLSKSAVNSGVRDQTGLCDDEIDLVDYFLVLWKHKWFIFWACVLPALVVGGILFLGHRDYKISYTYNLKLDEKAFKILKDKFYSAENIEKLSVELQAKGLNGYAEKVTGVKADESTGWFVSFQVSPSYFENIELSKVESLEELEKLQQITGTLLIMQVNARSKENIREIALVCRNNFEQVIPLYSVREELNSKLMDIKEEMADIEESKYMLSLQLERKKSTLEKLKNSGSEGSASLPNNITLQFDNLSPDSVYLPLVYQVQAAETQIINLQEQIRAHKEKYDYCDALLNLNGMLLSHVEKSIPLNHYTLTQLCVFLNDTMAQYKEDSQQLHDYLKAYIKRIENKIAGNMPLVEKPKLYFIAKGMVRKIAIVFVVALLLSVFAAFLLESIQKKQAKV